MATAPTANPQGRNARGAYGPTHAARAAGTAKMPAPTIMLTMPAAKAQGPTARTNPISRWFCRTKGTITCICHCYVVLGSQRIVLAGHSSGGFVAALTGTACPQVRALVLISASHGADESARQ